MLDNGDLWVQFDGMGYAFTSLSRKVTFHSAATIQYNQDFKCADDNSIYAYFDTRTVSPPDFGIITIEQPVANLVHASGNSDEAKYEVELWFSADELFDYKTLAEQYTF